MARRKQRVREQVLEQAMSDVADREDYYGNPLINHARVSTLMAAYQRCKGDTPPDSPIDSIIFQILTNVARLIETPSHQPAWENIAGYAAIGAEVSNG